MKSFRLVALMLCIVLLPVSVIAGEDISLNELKRLPKYCHNLSPGYFTAEALKYRRPVRDPGVPHMQHYCEGLVWMARAISGRGSARYAYTNAEDDFSYVVSRTINDPKYRSYAVSALLQRASANAGLKRDDQALEDFYKVIRIKPDYIKAYIRLAEFYKATGDMGEARRVIDEGLKVSPKSKSLLRRKKRFAN